MKLILGFLAFVLMVFAGAPNPAAAEETVCQTTLEEGEQIFSNSKYQIDLVAVFQGDEMQRMLSAKPPPYQPDSVRVYLAVGAVLEVLILVKGVCADISMLMPKDWHKQFLADEPSVEPAPVSSLEA